MLVSVIVTTKNRYELACHALRSVFNQSYKKIEVILVNDGDIYDFSEFKNLLIINNSHSKGGAYSRNIGAKNSKGDILCFLDDDDHWREDKLFLQINKFKKNDIGLVYTGRNIFYDNKFDSITRTILPFEEGKLYPRILFENPIGVTSSVAIRRDIFFSCGGFDEDLPCRQDYDLWIRICKITNITFINQPCLYYRISTIPGTQISNSYKRHITAYNILLLKYKPDVDALGYLKSRKVRANLLFSVAKAHRRAGYLLAFPYIIRSFFLYPNIKSVSLLLPKCILNRKVSL